MPTTTEPERRRPKKEPEKKHLTKQKEENQTLNIAWPIHSSAKLNRKKQSVTFTKTWHNALRNTHLPSRGHPSRRHPFRAAFLRLGDIRLGRPSSVSGTYVSAPSVSETGRAKTNGTEGCPWYEKPWKSRLFLPGASVCATRLRHPSRGCPSRPSVSGSSVCGTSVSGTSSTERKAPGKSQERKNEKRKESYDGPNIIEPQWRRL